MNMWSKKFEKLENLKDLYEEIKRVPLSRARKIYLSKYIFLHGHVLSAVITKGF